MPLTFITLAQEEIISHFLKLIQLEKKIFFQNAGELNKMIIKQELVKKIRDYFSLNIYETKVWLALLSKGVASAGEIAEMSGVPRSRTYDVLERLEKQGLERKSCHIDIPAAHYYAARRTVLWHFAVFVKCLLPLLLWPPVCARQIWV